MSLISSISGMVRGPQMPLNPRELPGAGLDKLSGGNAADGVGRSKGAAQPTEGFGQMVDRFVSSVDAKMQTADTEKTKVLTGESANLHQAMIAMQEASVGFTMMVEVRNKLVESYQELMRMQI